MKIKHNGNEVTEEYKNYFYRIILSPIIFLWGVFILIALSLIPIAWMVVIYSLVGMLSTPIIYLLKIGGSDIEFTRPVVLDFSVFENNKNVFLMHFIGFTIQIWGAFAITYHYIKTGEIYFIDQL